MRILMAVVVLLSFAVAAYFYPQMPERMASHWNAQGEVDGHMSKFWGLFLMPFISLGMAALFLLIPRMDPLRSNIEAFRKYYEGFVALVILFLSYVYVLTILWNLGLRFDIGRMMAPALGALFYACGVLIGKSKRNWFIGIRTPWTLSSEKVWEKTHAVGGKLFKIAGLIAFLGVFWPDYAILLVLVPVMLAAFWSIVYSYLEYRKVAKA